MNDRDLTCSGASSSGVPGGLRDQDGVQRVPRPGTPPASSANAVTRQDSAPGGGARAPGSKPGPWPPCPGAPDPTAEGEALDAAEDALLPGRRAVPALRALLRLGVPAAAVAAHRRSVDEVCPSCGCSLLALADVACELVPLHALPPLAAACSGCWESPCACDEDEAPEGVERSAWPEKTR